MKTYDYQKQLRAVWERTVSQFETGNRDLAPRFDMSERSFLEEIGMSPTELVDFAEDFVNYGEPDFETVAMIQDVRRLYLDEVQNGNRSKQMIDPDSLPAAEATAAGFTWLPRIIEKAKAKLRGELHPDIMYGCPNDRRFLTAHEIHPAEFLRRIRENEEDREAFLKWFVEGAKVLPR